MTFDLLLDACTLPKSNLALVFWECCVGAWVVGRVLRARWHDCGLMERMVGQSVV
jgi:hypothetical protein